MLRVGEECRRSRKGYQILFYLFTRNLATGKCQEISDLFLQVLGGSQSFYVLPRSLSLTFTSETLQGDPHPQNSIYYLITKTAVAVKKKKKRKKERNQFSFQGTLESPRRIRLVKHLLIHILDEVPRLKLKSSLGFWSSFCFGQYLSFLSFCFRSLLGLVLPPSPALHGWRQFDLQFDWELHFCLEGETSKSVSQIIPRRLQYCARAPESVIFMSDCISNV